MSMNELTFGCDPELFVFDTVAQKYVTGHGLIPGTKEKPFKVKGGAVQVDGMALEFNTDPAKSPEEAAENIASVLSELKKMLPQHLRLAAKPTVEFGKEYLDSMPEEAKELGCEPDYNAYTGQQNPRPDGNQTFRTSAGHIHIGWGEGFVEDDPDHMEACCMFAKFLDYYVGAASALWDDDDQRRTLYGDRGAFRPKSYGMEYRSPSSAWLLVPELRAGIFKLVQKAWAAAMETGGVPQKGLLNITERVFEGEKGELPHFNSEIRNIVGKSFIQESSDEESLLTDAWKFSVKPSVRDVYLIEDFEQCMHSLDKTDVVWATGKKPSEHWEEVKGCPITLLAGAVLVVTDVTNQTPITLADKWVGEEKKEDSDMSETDKESEYFV